MIHKIQAVIVRDFKECISNMAIITSFALPVVMALMFSRMENVAGGGMPAFIIYTLVGITFVSVLTSSGLTLLAEENEHQTMAQYMRSRGDLFANLIGKSVLLLAMTFLPLIIVFMVMGGLFTFNGAMLVAFIQLSLFFLLITLGFGLISKTLATTSLYLIIILFLFAMAPYVEFLITDAGNIVRQLIGYTPIYQNIEVHHGNVVEPNIILLLWNIAAFMFLTYAFNKKAKSL